MAVSGWEDSDRVALWDPGIGRVWTADPAGIAEGLEQFGGYAILKAKELKKWLARRIENGAENTICGFLQGVVPSGIADVPFDTCPLRRYMMAGGRVVWIGYHIPFGCVELVLGGHENRGPAAMHAILGVVPEFEHGYMKLLTTLVNLNPKYPQSGFLQLNYDAATPTWSGLKNFMERAAAGIGEPMPGHALFNEERKEPPPSDPDGGVLVESGTFTIDRKHAVEKLQLYQLPDPWMFSLPLLRSLAACGAPEAKITRTAGRWILKANGAKPPLSALERPFDALFSDAEPAAQQLAIGLLAALRTRPGSIEISAPQGTLRVRDFERWAFDPDLKWPNRFRIEVSWGIVGLSHGYGRKASRLAKAAFSAERFSLTVGRSKAKRMEFEHDLPALDFEENHLRGRIQVPPSIAFSSLLDIHHLGVWAAQTHVGTHPASVRGIIDADSIGLSLSQTGVVRDERFDEMLKTLSGPIERLILLTLPNHSARLKAAAKAVLEDAGARDIWKSYLDHPGGSDGAARRLQLQARRKLRRWGLGNADEDKLIETAFVAAWLRMASDSIGEIHPLLGAPLYFSADGGTLSYRRMKEIMRERGYLPFSNHINPKHPEAHLILQVIASGDYRTLQAHWNQMKDCTQAHAGNEELPQSK